MISFPFSSVLMKLNIGYLGHFYSCSQTNPFRRLFSLVIGNFDRIDSSTNSFILSLWSVLRGFPQADSSIAVNLRGF